MGTISSAGFVDIEKATIKGDAMIKVTIEKVVTKIVGCLGYDISVKRKCPEFIDDRSFTKSCEENAIKLQRLGVSKAHYGGLDFGEGWVNIDRGKRAQIRTDLTRRHPFPSNFFSFAFSQDFLEHLDQAESIFFLCEAYRTLKCGGILRMSFPGLKGMLEGNYKSSDYVGASIGQNKAYTMWEHKHYYSEESLTTVARHIGFSDINFVEYGKSQYKELCNLDSRPDQKDSNIIVELKK
jgi:predicted SAM-dependent methyltransferase